MAQAQVIITATDRTQSAITSATRGLQGLTQTFGVLNKAIAASGIYMAGQVLTRTIMKSIEFGDELAKASIKAGIAGEQMSSLAYAARQSDVDIGSLSIALRKMQIALSEASTGGKGQKEALDALGISLNEIKQLEPDKQFELLADRINALTSPADRARAATDLFGKSGAELLPMFEKGAQGIREARLEAEQLGITLSTDQQKALADADDAIKRLTASWDAWSTKAVAKFAPAMTKLLDAMSGKTGYTTLFPGYENLAMMGGYAANSTLSAQMQAQADAAFAAAAAAQGDNKKTAPGYKESLKSIVTINDVVIESTKKTVGAMQKLYEEYNKNTQTTTEKTLSDFAAFEAQIDELLNAGMITREQATMRMSEELDKILAPVEVTGKKSFSDNAKKEFSAMSEFARAAAQNMQSVFANFLFDPFQNGLRGMLAGFMEMIRRMVAELIAQQILTSFFTWLGTFTGPIGTIGAALLSGMPGQKANGGPVSGNTPYIVGERGPELFMPSTSGTIVPNHRLGGGVTVAPVYNIDARGATADLQAALPSILKENNRRIFDELDRRYGIGR